MTGSSTISLIATVLVIANFVLVSSAVQTYNLGQLGKKSLRFNEASIVTPEQQIFAKRFVSRNRSNRFIGDLVIGEEQPDQTVYIESLELTNPLDQDASGSLSFTVPSGTINFVAVLNAPDGMIVICDTPETLGSSTSVVNVRMIANSTSKLLVVVAAH